MKLDGELSSLRKAINASTGMLQALRQLVDQPGAVNTPTTHAGGGWGVDGGMPSVLEDPLDMLWADSAHGVFVFCVLYWVWADSAHGVFVCVLCFVLGVVGGVLTRVDCVVCRRGLRHMCCSGI